MDSHNKIERVSDVKGMELVEHVYKDSSMSVFSLKELLKEIKKKDNKIFTDVEHLISGYNRYVKDSSKILKKESGEFKTNNFFEKMMAKEGIKKEVKSDNSDASIADMLIKGISMGSLDMEKKIKKYEEVSEKSYLKLAHDYLNFSKDNMTALKKYL